MDTEQYDILLHAFMTHHDVQRLMQRLRSQNKEHVVVLSGRNHLAGGMVMKKLAKADFLTIMFELVEKAERKEQLEQELKALQALLEGKDLE